MKRLFVFALLFALHATAFCQSGDTKIVIIRHGEKPEKGNNLTCKGLNRSLQLPPVLVGKFGVPAYTYVPSLSLDEKTKHARMLETIIPIAAKYNLTINSKYDEHDFAGIAKDIKEKKGTVLVAWEHHAIPSIVKALGIAQDLSWPDDDFDSIWVVTLHDGKATLYKDKEDIHPSDKCPY